MRLILASSSPRRADLLRAAGFSFDVVAPSVDERLEPGETPAAYVQRLARAKVFAASSGNSGGRVCFFIGADTTVVLEGQMLGKPRTSQEAREMLEALSGRVHEVLTGVAVGDGSRWCHEVAVTRVRFLPLAADEIAWYVATGEPFDKAGGYGIQGLAARFVDSIEGSYSNVVGLPVATVYRLLRNLGWPE